MLTRVVEEFPSVPLAFDSVPAAFSNTSQMPSAKAVTATIIIAMALKVRAMANRSDTLPLSDTNGNPTFVFLRQIRVISWIFLSDDHATIHETTRNAQNLHEENQPISFLLIAIKQTDQRLRNSSYFLPWIVVSA